MPFNDYITLDGKKYKALDLGQGSWQPIYNRPKVYDIGLTGLSIIQDFTVSDREPRVWKMTLRVFISDPFPDNSFGVFDDFLEAYREPYIDFTEHDGVTQHVVGIESPVVQVPQVGANLEGHCNGVDWIEVSLVKIYQ